MLEGMDAVQRWACKRGHMSPGWLMPMPVPSAVPPNPWHCVSLLPCVTAGIGLVAPTPFGRFEANYVWVLTAQEHDRFKSGLQWGFASSGML